MKASELMIGDLVRVTEDVCIKKGTIVEIVGIDATRTLPKHGLVGCTLCTPLNRDDGLYGGYGGVWTAFLEPIPLTVEILKKNGFTDGKYRHFNGNVWKLEADGFREIHLTEKVRKAVLWGERIDLDYPNSVGDKFAIPFIRYVHELQHAMRLCGIDKKINI